MTHTYKSKKIISVDVPQCVKVANSDRREWYLPGEHHIDEHVVLLVVVFQSHLVHLGQHVHETGEAHEKPERLEQQSKRQNSVRFLEAKEEEEEEDEGERHSGKQHTRN